jgi:N-acetylneuraminic acid mutarotase
MFTIMSLGIQIKFRDFITVLSWIREEWPEAPRGRIFGNSWEYDGYIYVAGGGAPGVDRFFVEGNYWEALPDFGTAPSTRYGATSVQVDSLVYLFGGVDKETGSTLNDFWVFDSGKLTYFLSIDH